MPPLFHSTNLQEEFEENGFVHIPFLSSAEVARLLDLYKNVEQEHKQVGLPFTTTSHSNNDELIRKSDEFIAEVFKPELDKILRDYKLLFGNFLVKNPGPGSVTPLHQDTTFVEENKYASISVWVSLHDTDKHNGCMRFVKGSHKYKFTLRPTHSYPWPFEGVRVQLENLLEDYPSQKGEAFIFHHGVIHASYTNITNQPRVAAVMAAYPAEADLLMLFAAKENPDLLNKYKMTREAYLHFIKGEPPAMGQLLGTVKFDRHHITVQEFESMISMPKEI
jgi:ectoine hydroxylase-related dioxygenase (phytanoyl-CoA dioxygenase family)